ncbi:MAG: T9SS type A sorting domain-containing protein [Bacteroidota bacterium]
MKKLKKKIKTTLSPLLGMCSVFLTLSAYSPFNSTNSTITSDNLAGLSMVDCPEDMQLSTDPWGCTASGELPIPTNIQGLCGGNEFLAETFQGGTLNVTGSLDDNDLSVFAMDFESGTHIVQYTISDSCDNVFTCEFEVFVFTHAAVAVSKQNIVVTLMSTSTNDDAKAILLPLDLDNGSYHPCHPIKLEIRRDMDLCDIPGNATYNADGHPNDGDPDPNSSNYDPDDGQLVEFCCEDLTSLLYDVNGDGVNDLGYIRVWLRVWDDANEDGIFGNDVDNYNETWSYVKVEDSLPAVIQCPEDTTLTCNLDFMNPDVAGWAQGFSSCGETPVEYTDILVNLNSCTEGFVTRRWSPIGQPDIFCDQTITVEGLDSPVIDITYPADITLSNCPDETIFGLPTWTAGPCDFVDYTLETDTLVFEDGACIKLINHWAVINWCKYDPDNPFWDGEGLWEGTQEVSIIDKTQPQLDDCEDKHFSINDHDDIDNDGIVCEAKITLTNLAIDEDSENCPEGWLHWQVFIDLWADGQEDMELSSFLPYDDDQYNDTNGNGIPDIYLSPTNSNEEVNVQLPDIVAPFSNHKVRWKVTDGCNNVKTCDFDFIVRDETPPTAICQDTITIGVNQFEPTRIWVINYVSEVMDNCSPTENLRYTTTETPPEDDPSYDPVRRSSRYTFDIIEITDGFVLLPIYVWDEYGNYTICETPIIIDQSIALDTEETTQNQVIKLHQNQPNPFQSSTIISFTLDQAAPVKLNIINAVSSEVLEINISGKEGLNSVTIDRTQFSGQGLYYYTMTTQNYKATKKMILIH